MSTPVKWGVCTTVKAPARQILQFAAHHLEAGAHRVWIYFDEDTPEARKALKAHPKCRAIVCDAEYWRRHTGKRPLKHQVRQSHNATRMLGRAGDVDWLLHIDVDEFVVADKPVTDSLDAVPRSALTARLRPMEALAPASGRPPTAFKRFIPPGPQRQATVARLYPEYGAHLKGGFLSHVAGKIFTRTNQTGVSLRIHNAFEGEQMNRGEVVLDEMCLAHLHASDWDIWRRHFEYRHLNGAYRAELAPVRPAFEGGTTLHAFFHTLLATEGAAGLRSFFDAVCADTPALRQRLQSEGLLDLCDLDLDAKLHHHFTEFTTS